MANLNFAWSAGKYDDLRDYPISIRAVCTTVLKLPYTLFPLDFNQVKGKLFFSNNRLQFDF
jgi:hypothetical protein